MAEAKSEVGSRAGQAGQRVGLHMERAGMREWKKLRAQYAVRRIAPSKSSRKVTGFRINPATQQPCG